MFEQCHVTDNHKRLAVGQPDAHDLAIRPGVLRSALGSPYRISSNRSSMSPMAEFRPPTLRRTRTGNSYTNQWNRLVAWSQASGRCALPASPEDIAAYLQDGPETGAKALPLRVAAAAIARNHWEAGFDVPFRRGPDRSGRANAGRCSRSEQGASPRPELLSRH